jgi:hypothetical protein
MDGNNMTYLNLSWELTLVNQIVWFLEISFDYKMQLELPQFLGPTFTQKFIKYKVLST